MACAFVRLAPSRTRLFPVLTTVNSGWKFAMSIRPVKRVAQSKPTLEGARVHLRRAFGFGNTSDFDPFLLLDDFRK